MIRHVLVLFHEIDPLELFTLLDHVAVILVDLSNLSPGSLGLGIHGGVHTSRGACH